MYPDTIMFIIGGLFTIILLGVVVYLVVLQREITKQQRTEHKESLTKKAITEMVNEATTKILATEDYPKPLEIQPNFDYGTVLIMPSTTRIGFHNNREADDSFYFYFESSNLGERYEIEKELRGGGMSRVFLAENKETENKWVVKFIPTLLGSLSGEAEILKKLNHTGLPKIIDIESISEGVFLVENFVEGVTLSEILKNGQVIGQSLILDWAKKLAEVLIYLHGMTPNPIYHLDLKPSNIMIIHDNRIVLIDFGISKFQDSKHNVSAVTYEYAAPEQLKNAIPTEYQSLITKRFGELPEARQNWDIDSRTDIFSLGVVLSKLSGSASREIKGIIDKCIEIEPANRYQSAQKLLEDIQAVSDTKVTITHKKFLRQIASVATAFSFMISGGSFGYGGHLYRQEFLSLIDVVPAIVTVSLQQTADLKVEKQLNGELSFLDVDQLKWTYTNDNIARINGSHLSGLNIGETEIEGSYRNKLVNLIVKVVPSMDGMIDISQRYQPGHIAQIYAGNNEREHINGTLAEASFVSPESIAVADDGTIYIADSGVLRKISNGNVSTVELEPGYLVPRIVRCFNNALYILTETWQDENDKYLFALKKLSDSGVEDLYEADGVYSTIEDFTFDNDGLLWFINRNAGDGNTYLQTLNTLDIEDINIVCTLPGGTSALTIDNNNAIYFVNPEAGVIQRYANGELSYFAGIENDKAFIDGAAPRFYMPLKIKYADDGLYIWDFNVLRYISVNSGIAGECITIAGEASPEFDLGITGANIAAENIILPNSVLTDIAVTTDGVLITDPKRQTVWRVK